MQSIKVLEMLEQGLIEELEDMLREEIYQDALKKKTGAKPRYSAMKKYFGYVKSSRPICMKPAMVEFDGETMYSFCNSYSLALTKESCGFIELFTEEDGSYPNVSRLLKRDGNAAKIDLRQSFAEAKSKGYKLTKAEVNGGRFMLRYNGTYYRMGLIDATYSIIDDGGEVTVYHSGDKFSSITIENCVGVCMVLPVKCDEESVHNDGITVIDLI